MCILKATNLSKVYGVGGNKVFALRNINICVNKDEFIAIVGPSGSGKSTLLHLLGGLDRPTEGVVQIDNDDIYKLSEDKLAKFRRMNIGFVFQQYNLIPVLNVRENIEMPIRLDSKVPDKEYIDDLIDFLRLTDRQMNLPSQLSGGEQQRVAIGRALSPKPAIILADEPTGNLDSKNSLEIVNLLKLSNQKYNQTIIMITHDVELASFADRIITLNDGKIISDKKNEKL